MKLSHSLLLLCSLFLFSSLYFILDGLHCCVFKFTDICKNQNCIPKVYTSVILLKLLSLVGLGDLPKGILLLVVIVISFLASKPVFQLLLTIKKILQSKKNRRQKKRVWQSPFVVNTDCLLSQSWSRMRRAGYRVAEFLSITIWSLPSGPSYLLEEQFKEKILGRLGSKSFFPHTTQACLNVCL